MDQTINPEWRVVWDGAWFIDGRACESFEEARNDAMDTLTEWQMEIISQHRLLSQSEMYTNREFMEDWNRMICECGVYVQHRDPIPVPADTESEDMGWEDYWHPSDEELHAIGWEQIKEETV